MIEIVPLTEQILDKIIVSSYRELLDFSEYSFLDIEGLKAIFRVSMTEVMENKEGSFAVAAIRNKTPLGFLYAIRNDFDTQMFGFPCFHLNARPLTQNSDEIKEVMMKLFDNVERSLNEKWPIYHLFIGVNNNIPVVTPLFNSLSAAGFTFINTLLTFGLTTRRVFSFKTSANNKFLIRKVRQSDADDISELAAKSFRYTRFHMDPFLDNTKADNLLRTSARNSVLHGFVDVMFVAEDDNKVIGYYSGKKKYISEVNKTLGTAVTTAVDADYRGLGIFSKLDDSLLNWFLSECDFAEMGTYLANYPVHKTWIDKNIPLIRGTYQFSKLVIREL